MHIRLPAAAMLALPLVLGACSARWTAHEQGYWQTGQDNQAPAISLDSPARGDTFTWHDAVVVAGTVEDDGDLTELRLAISSNVDGLVAEPEPSQDGSFSAELSGLSAGKHTLLVMATDAGGRQASATVSIEVYANRPPSDPEVAIDPPEPSTGDALSATLVTPSEDPDDDPVSYTWSWSVDGVDKPAYTGPDLPGGVIDAGESWTVTVTASDGQLESAAASDTVVVADALPVVQVDISPADPGAADTLTCTWTAEDPDGQPITSEDGTWLVGGVEAGDAATPLSGVFYKGDVVACSVSATSDSGTTEAEDQVTILNTPPVVDTVELLGTPATEQDVITCSGTTSDIDGDTVTVATTWYVDGVVAGSGADTLDGSSFDKGDEVWCELLPSDGEDQGTAAASAHTTIQNSPPGAPGDISVDPGDVPAGTPLDCTVGTAATDPDPADSLSYEYDWQVNGSSAGGGETLDTSSLSSGDSVLCQVRASDGTDVSGWASSSTVTVIDRLDGSLPASSATLEIGGTTKGDGFGRAIASPGDMDGDGHPELFAAAPAASSAAGAIYVFSGSTLAGASAPLTDADAQAMFSGADPGGRLGNGAELVAAGDVDGDGLPDLLAAAHLAYGTGEAYLLAAQDYPWTSSTGIHDAAAIRFAGDHSGDQLGYGLGAADIDGDGLSDVFLANPRDDTAASDAGAIAVFLGTSLASASGTLAQSDADHLVTGSSSGDHLGECRLVASPGDIDDDGYEDIAVCSTSGAGVLYLLSGSSLGTGEASSLAFATISGESDGDDFGYGIAAAGDLDADGHDDIFAGARFGDVDAAGAGALYFFSGASLSGGISAAAASASWGGDADSELLGTFISGGTDMDLDGYPELLVSDHYRDGAATNSGRACLLLGNTATWSTSLDLSDSCQATFEGAQKNDFFGGTFAFLDFDADGFPDIAIGAENGDAATTNAGSVYLFAGP